ncbi:14324_t:CDS:2, partial [Racocetra fulgida]
SDEPIYDLEFNGPTYDSVVVVQENKDVGLDCSKEKLYEGMYQEFVQDFYTARNSLVPEVFEQKWKQLIKKYNEPRVVKYLKTLYSSKKAWVRAYITKIFTAGIQSTSRVESYNAQVKRLVLNSNISLLELAEALEASIEEEIKKAKYAYWKIQILLTSSAATLPQTLFPELDKALSRFITPEIQKIQRAEIK